MSEAELDATVVAEPDDPGNDPEFWDRARLVFPRKERVTLRLAADVLDWFRRQGRGYQARINAILRRISSMRATGRGLRAETILRSNCCEDDAPASDCVTRCSQ
jgi:uncharacterized protein (DUF4415 family)